MANSRRNKAVSPALDHGIGRNRGNNLKTFKNKQMKTAMQELIQDILNSNPDVKVYDLQNILRRDMVKYLKNDRINLINSYQKGVEDFANYDPERHGNKIPNGEDYFNETFKK